MGMSNNFLSQEEINALLSGEAMDNNAESEADKSEAVSYTHLETGKVDLVLPLDQVCDNIIKIVKRI